MSCSTRSGERSRNLRQKKSLVEQKVLEKGQPRPSSRDARVEPCRYWLHLPACASCIFRSSTGEPSSAIEVLQIAGPYDLAIPGSWSGFFGNLYPVYAHGEACLAAPRDVDAVAEFQKILNNRGIVFSDPVGALAHLQLGRAYALSGDRSRAKDAYKDFLTLWKDADPDIPILKQAKAEYAKLQ